MYVGGGGMQPQGQETTCNSDQFAKQEEEKNQRGVQFSNYKTRKPNNKIREVNIQNHKRSLNFHFPKGILEKQINEKE